MSLLSHPRRPRDPMRRYRVEHTANYGTLLPTWVVLLDEDWIGSADTEVDAWRVAEIHAARDA